MGKGGMPTQWGSSQLYTLNHLTFVFVQVHILIVEKDRNLAFNSHSNYFIYNLESFLFSSILSIFHIAYYQNDLHHKVPFHKNYTNSMQNYSVISGFDLKVLFCHQIPLGLCLQTQPFVPEIIIFLFIYMVFLSMSYLCPRETIEFSFYIRVPYP